MCVRTYVRTYARLCVCMCVCVCVCVCVVCFQWNGKQSVTQVFPFAAASEPVVCSRSHRGGEPRHHEAGRRRGRHRQGVSGEGQWNRCVSYSTRTRVLAPNSLASDWDVRYAVGGIPAGYESPHLNEGGRTAGKSMKLTLLVRQLQIEMFLIVVIKSVGFLLPLT